VVVVAAHETPDLDRSFWIVLLLIRNARDGERLSAAAKCNEPALIQFEMARAISRGFTAAATVLRHSSN
jgi:hypothetical protein